MSTIKKKKKTSAPAEDAGEGLKKINNVSLAVKYRPVKLEDLVGQQDAVKKIKTMLKDRDIPGAIILTGPTGCGKTTISQILARYINCDKGTACGKCQNCQLSLDKHPDYEQMNASDSRGIDDIRAVIMRSRNRPRIGNMRVIHLDEVHQLTPQASEALLVPLENPPEQTLFILSTTDPDKLKQTLLNRCTPIMLSLVDHDLVMERLAYINEQEKLGFGKKVLNAIAEFGTGYMRDTLRLLESARQIKRASPKIEDQALIDAVSKDAGTGNDPTLDDMIVRVLVASYACKPVSIAKYMADLRTDYVSFLQKCVWLTQYLIDAEIFDGQRHPNVWHSPLNLRFRKAVKSNLPDYSPKKNLAALADLVVTLTSLRQTMTSGGVSTCERALITANLIQWATRNKK